MDIFKSFLSTHIKMLREKPNVLGRTKVIQLILDD